MQIITIQTHAQCVKYPKIAFKSGFSRCDAARYYRGCCINHAVLERISSKNLSWTVVPPPVGEGAGLPLIKGIRLLSREPGVGVDDIACEIRF